MPKSTPTPPKYRHHKPSGRAIVTLNGRDHYLGKWRTRESLVEYQRLIGEWIAGNGQSPPDGPTTELTVSELVSRYWSFAPDEYFWVRSARCFSSISRTVSNTQRLFSRT